MTILTCYATSIVVIYLNLPASMRLFTFDINGGYLMSIDIVTLKFTKKKKRISG